jgi:hypothetical protein
MLKAGHGKQPASHKSTAYEASQAVGPDPWVEWEGPDGILYRKPRADHEEEIPCLTYPSSRGVVEWDTASSTTASTGLKLAEPVTSRYFLTPQKVKGSIEVRLIPLAAENRSLYQLAPDLTTPKGISPTKKATTIQESRKTLGLRQFLFEAVGSPSREPRQEGEQAANGSPIAVKPGPSLIARPERDEIVRQRSLFLSAV